MILIIDNYDSFTYNLFQYAGEINPDVRVVLNDELSVAEIDALKPSHIIISPGPGRPEDAGICLELVRDLGDRYPILGICLGHQAICQAFGAKVELASELVHGKASDAHIANGNELFTGLAPLLRVARYHSLAVLRDSLPDELLIIAETQHGEVMGIKHRDFPIFGLQFHPESILTESGRQIIENFLALKGVDSRD